MDMSWEKTWRSFYPEGADPLTPNFRASSACSGGNRIVLSLHTSVGSPVGAGVIEIEMTPEQMRACAGALLSAADYAEALTERLHAARAAAQAAEATPC